MTPRAYSVARVAAPAVEAHLRRHHDLAFSQGWENLAPVADADVIEAIVEAGFWASLRREEGRVPKISLAFLPPAQSAGAMLFDRRIPLQPGALARLAPAVERPGIHLGVWRDEQRLYVWGATRSLPNVCLVLEVVEPGLLVVKYSRDEEYGKFGNVAVLRGDQVDVVDEERATDPGSPVLLASLLGIDRPRPWLNKSNVLVQLAVSMRAHGHGGLLLVVPAATQDWQASAVLPIPYRISSSFGRLAELIVQDPNERDGDAWREALRRAVEGIAGVTAVDGATVLNERYELLAFGVKIKRLEGAATVGQVVVTEPVVGNEPAVLEPGEIGGTRHLSAAQFVHDQRNALALVASQDGRFTVFAWSDRYQLVQAHRIDALLF